MNKNVKNRKNRRLVAVLVVFIALLAAMLAFVWKQESGSQTPETELPETTAAEAPAEVETDAPETLPEETEEEIFIETEPEVDAPEAGSITYAEYLALDVEVQQAYYNKFASPEDFFLWLNAAKAEHEASTEPQPTTGSEDGEQSTEPTDGIIVEDEDVEDW